jgi:tripartite-type tricarboxylate transporter receptor subunit TctC
MNRACSLEHRNRTSTLDEHDSRACRCDAARLRAARDLRRLNFVRFAIALTAAVGMLPEARAQAYPERSIRFVVPFPPGGATDFIARILATRLPAALGQSIVVDNRSGGGGNIGTAIVAKATPDGHTLLVASESPITINPSVYSNLAYNTVRDLPAITQMIHYPYFVVLHPSVPAASVRELIQAAKAQPGRLRYAHAGVGSGTQLAAELFKLQVGVDIVGVPYKGAGPAMVGLLGNETHLGFASPPSSIAHVKSGKLKAIAVTSEKRSALLPDLATVRESGIAGFDVGGWVGLFAPAGAPGKIVERLHAEVAKVLRVPEVKDVLLASGSEPSDKSTEEIRALVRTETAMWAKVIKTTGIKIE